MWIIAPLLLVFTCGCAFSYVDKDGGRNIIGLAKVRIPPNQHCGDVAGDSIDVTSIGLGGHSTPISTGFSFGYQRDRMTTLYNDSQVGSLPAGGRESLGEDLGTE
ncbi:hypothetical protein ACFL2T_05690 [Elusimicrobiota bacterium]